MEQGTGPVGRLSTEGLSDVLNCMGTGFKQCGNLKSLFEAAYLKHDNLADATPLANSLLEHTVW
jgi:hypothetical protein